MTETDREPIATIALIASLADGERGADEQRQLEQITTAIGGGDVDQLARKVLSGQARLADVAAKLSDDGARRQAYEMALLVCHADGSANEKEKAFLADLRQLLKLAPDATSEVDSAAQGLAVVPVAGPVAEGAGSAGVDDMIMKNAMLAGALELLPQSVASLAIVPLQARLVYRIGADHGQKLDANQIKDLAGAMGLGAAAQVMEGVARRVMGGLAKGVLGKVLGGLAGGAAGAATGVGLTFASTYALGHAAKQYYAQGRSLSRDDLKSLFTKLKGEASTIYPRVEAEIKQQAANLKLTDIMSRLRSAV